MKKLLWAALCAGWLSAVAQADVVQRMPDVKPSTAPAVALSTASVEPFKLVDVPNEAFDVGEKLTFAIKYQFVTGGFATMEVSEGWAVDGRPTLQIESRAESTGAIDAVFRVRDFNASSVDRGSLMSRRFHQNLKEGGYSVIRNTELDYRNHVYKFSRVRREHLTERSGAIPEPMHDILSAFFYARTLDLKPGETYQITVFSDEESYSLAIKVNPKIQKISVAAGKFSCLRLEPKLMGDGIFKGSEDSRMTIWLTNDKRKIPVLIRSKVFIGAFDAELKSYVPPTGWNFDTLPSK